MPSVLSSSAWPALRNICLHCRTLVPERSCLCGSDEVVELDRRGRLALVDRVWGPLQSRVPVNRPAMALYLTGGVTIGLSTMIVDLAGLVVGAGALATGALVRALRVGREHEDLRERSWALPASDAALPVAAQTPFAGRVVTEAVGLAPMTFRYCVAYAVELRSDRGDAIYLRDAVTLGFDVAGNDGRIVSVPPGPIQLAGGGSREIVLDDQIRAYLTGRDPFWRPDRYDPFPYATAFEAVVCEGDRIELHNALEPVHDPNAPADYRHTATTRLRAVGVPRVYRRVGS